MYSLETVFDNFAPTMEKFVKNAHEIGLSQKDAAKASVFLGSVLKQSGFSMEDVTEQSQKLVSLGVDLAATYGYDVQEALLGMTALFRGEYDPIEKFGVAMKQSEINAELAARGQDKLEGAARRNAEQIIRMELLYQRAADATGAFTGQSGNLFVEQMKLQAQFENMQASIGTQLLPVMVSLTEALVPLVDYIGPRIAQAVNDSIPALEGFSGLIKDISDSTTFAGGTVKVLLDTFGAFFSLIVENFGVLLAFTALITAVTTAIKLYTIAAAFAAANPIGAAIILLGGAFIVGAAGAKTLTDDVNLAGASLQAYNGNLQNAVETGVYAGGKFGMLKLDFAETSDEARRLSNEVSAADSAKLNNLKDSIMSVKISAVEAANEIRRMRIYAGVGDVAAASTTTTKTGGSSGASRAAAMQEQALREMVAAQEQAARELAAAQEEARRKEEERLRKRNDAYKSFADSVKSTFGGIKQSIMSAFSLPDLGGSVNSITRNIKKLLQQTKDFARNITSLSQQGLTNDLLQQVIAAGPMGGGRLAQALAGAGGGFIGELNQAYGEFGGIASGIAGVGTTAAFANREVVNNYYQIEVSGGVGSGPTIGKAIVDAIKSYERTSGAVWQGA
jgi:predicted ribosomally synthesized peptide with SipW-like signal peptide